MTQLHLYLVASGGFISAASGLASEIWQTGTRLTVQLGTASDPIGSFPDDEFDVVPVNHSRIEDDWTITGNWSLEGGITDFDPADYLNDQAGPAWDAFMGATGAANVSVQLRQLRLYPIGSPDGKVIPAPPYAQGSPIVLQYDPPVPGAHSTGNMMPPNCSVVASLRTAQLGRRGRGRMFLPPQGSGVLGGSGADVGLVTSTARGNIAAAMVALMEGLIYEADGNALAVRPIVTGAPYGDYALVNSIQVGNVVDGQHRRRRALTEVRTTAAVTNP